MPTASLRTAVIYHQQTGKIELSASFLDERDEAGAQMQAQGFALANAGGRAWLIWSGPASPDQHRVLAGAVVPLAQADLVEKEWAKVRYRRFQLLSETDWRVTRAAETGVPVAPQWLAYRQALRDVTNQPDPFNITWPTPPG
jgi:hypothetical protein